jgi:hypothetical protein
MDCGASTWDLDEFYMVADAWWRWAVPDVRGMLCKFCLEARLGRPLGPRDFLPLRMNKHLYRPEPEVHEASQVQSVSSMNIAPGRGLG